MMNPYDPYRGQENYSPAQVRVNVNDKYVPFSASVSTSNLFIGFPEWSRSSVLFSLFSLSSDYGERDSLEDSSTISSTPSANSSRHF